MECTLPRDWNLILQNELGKPYFHQLKTFIHTERAYSTMYPSEIEVFSAFYSTRFDQVKVVILGQDPYARSNQAHGISFSIKQ